MDVVANKVSTGGPNALADVLPPIPKDCPVFNLIVHHLSPAFTKGLYEHVSLKSAIPVSEAQEGTMRKWNRMECRELKPFGNVAVSSWSRKKPPVWGGACRGAEGDADKILPLSQIADVIVRIVQMG